VAFNTFLVKESGIFKNSKNRQRYRERLRKKNKTSASHRLWFLTEKDGYLFFENTS